MVYLINARGFAFGNRASTNPSEDAKKEPHRRSEDDEAEKARGQERDEVAASAETSATAKHPATIENASAPARSSGRSSSAPM
jgi:hypothetical protein